MMAGRRAARSARLLAVGVSHKTAAIEDRERAALNDRLAREVLRALGRQDAVSEAVVLSTCNRTELYAVVQDPGAGEAALRSALDPNGFVWVVVGDAAKIRPQLERLRMPITVMAPR